MTDGFDPESRPDPEPFPGRASSVGPAAPDPFIPNPRTDAESGSASSFEAPRQAGRGASAPIEPGSPDATPPTWAPPSPSRAAPSPSTGRRSRGPIALVLAASVLSAGLASAGTAALVANSRSPTPAASTADAAQNVALTSTTAAVKETVTSSSDAVVSAVASVSPAVVTITTTVQANRGPFTASGTGVGSGFIYASNGWILTNAHVVEGATSVSVTLASGKQYTGRVVTSDTSADLAVVKIDATGLPTATIGTSSALKVGQSVIAIGSPLGEFSGSVTLGVLSGEGRSITVTDEQTGQPRTMTNLLQTDAAMNPGNSGGPLIDLSGAVIGISTAASSSAQGIGFAIPIEAAQSIMTAAQKTV